MSRQYLSAKFRPGDGMAYTFHNDGVPVAKGEQVLVSGKGGNGTRTVIVHEVGLPMPKFATKPIIGPAPPGAEPEPEKPVKPVKPVSGLLL